MARLDYSSAIALIDGARTVCICGHINPDGDCLGSVLALTHALRARGKSVTPLLADGDAPDQYDFLPGYDLFVPAADYRGIPDLYISLDVPSLDRMGDGAAVFKRARHTVLIDHHTNENKLGDARIVDPNTAAVGVMVWDMIDQMGVQRSAEIATCCYTSVVTDTGRFQFQNTDAACLRVASAMAVAGARPSEICDKVYQRRSLAALKLEALVIQRLKFLCGGKAAISWVTRQDFADLGAQQEDSSSLVDTIRQLDGIEVVVFLREQDGSVRGSIRSKTERDVAAIARKLGGGGHVAAAGFTVRGGLADAMKAVVPLLAESFGYDPHKKGAHR